jgi:uncharacterized repeat protein (TIGR02543 family)
MEKMSFRHRKTSFLAAICGLFALITCACALFPAYAFASGGNILAYTYEGGVRTYYTSIQEAIQVGYDKGYTIYMARDWEISSRIDIADNKTLTIDMNGHAIRSTTSGSDSIITLNKNANLTLKSTTTSTFTYTGYDNATGNQQSCTIQTGGLVTGGNTNYAGCMRVLANATLTLDNVAIAGNTGHIVAGLEAKDNSTINMKNGASIEHNSGNYKDSGYGGIYANGDDVTINMDDSKISKNYSIGKTGGGGVYSGASATRIFLKNNSTISENYAKQGGGVYFAYAYFGIYGDNTGSITGNHAYGDGSSGYGGGVCTENCRWHTSEGTLQDISITGNVANNNGGGVDLNQNWTRVINCTIKGNQTLGGDGGGVRVHSSNISLESCTITDNFCSDSKEGGGVFVDSQYDIKLIGKTVIQNNTRGQNGSKDDLFLEDTPFTKAYITGGVDEGSKVGVRLSQDGERRFGKNVTTYTTGTYFIDLDGYYVTHGTDAGGDLWQRKSADMKFPLNVNGTEVGLYKYGEAVSVNGNSSDSSKVFWYWDAESAKGLVPISDYITDENKYDPTLSFSMPQDGVFVNAKYADAITKGKFTVEKPVPGQELATEATFVRTDSGEGPSEEIPELAVTWYEVDANGNKTQATGKAKYDTTYVAEFSIRNQQYNGVAFSPSIVANDMNVSMSGDESETHSAASASVTADTGVLAVDSWQYTTPKPAVKVIAKTYMTAPVGTSAHDLEAMLPSKATVHLEDGSSVVVDTDTSRQINWPDGLFDEHGFVKNPEGGSLLLNMELPLKENSAVPGIEKKTVTVEITVNSAGAIGTPQLSPAGGVSTYNKYWGETRLDENLVLTVKAECITEGASIKYKVDGGDERLANNGEIRLQGTANEIVEHNIVVWAEKAVGGTTLKSQEVTGTYYLDDTINKEITISCTDTGSYDGTTPWTKSFTATGDLGLKATITAPAQDGRIFSHWEWDGAPEGVNLNSSTLTIPKFSQDLNGKIKAVYIPVISSIDLGFDAPAAHSALAESASSVNITVGSDATTADILSCFANDGRLSWSPTTGTSSSAAHSTIYTAQLQWKSSDGAVEYALADNVKLTFNGQTVEGAVAYDAATESGRSLGITFPATSGLSVSKMDDVSDVDMTHNDACIYQSEVDAGRTSSWGLPSEVKVTCTCGETDQVDISWKVEGFSSSNLEAQTLTATGTLSYPASVDAKGAPATIAATINVAAAEKAATPAAEPAAGTYDGAQQIMLTCETTGATIRYTADGTDPATSATSIVFDGTPIEVSDNTTVKACALRDDLRTSDVAEFGYSIQRTVTFDSAGGSAVESQKVVSGACATKPANPTLEGFDFDCWADADGNEYKFNTPVASDITLYAKWTKSGESTTACTVTFDTAGGSAVATQTVTPGDKAEQPADPTLEGFDFQGWLTEDGEAYDFSTPVTSSLKLCASWSKSSEPIVAHEVTFDTAGGSPIASQVVAEGFTADVPSTPVLEGFTFDYWADIDGNKFDFEKTAVTSDIALYAHWTASADPIPACLVTFDSSGGSAVGAQTVVKGGTATEPSPAPTRDGYTFDGWFLENGSKYNFATPVTSDLKLCAHWSKGGEPVAAYTVTFDSAGGSAAESQKVGDGDMATEPNPAPTWDGYTFLGWFTEDGEAYNFSTPVTSDVVLYAKWQKSGDTKPAHTVIFDSAGGSAVGALTVGDGEVATEPDAPTRDGWTFDGWFLENGSKYDFATPVTSDLKLCAHWSKGGEPVAAYTVTFDSSGGSDVPSQTVAAGDKATRPVDPVLDGFTFQYWADANGNEYSFDTPVTSDLTLYAVWAASGEPAPAPSGSEPAAEAAAEAAAADKSASAKTADALPLNAAGAIAVIAALAAVAAAVARRRSA